MICLGGFRGIGDNIRQAQDQGKWSEECGNFCLKSEIQKS